MACERYEPARSQNPFQPPLRQNNFVVTESVHQRVSGCNGNASTLTHFTHVSIGVISQG